MAKFVVVFHDVKLGCDVYTGVFNDRSTAKTALYQFGVRHSNADLKAYVVGEVYDGEDLWEFAYAPREEIFDLAHVIRLNEEALNDQA